MNELRPRVLVLAGILALAFTGVVGRLGWLQIVRHDASDNPSRIGLAVVRLRAGEKLQQRPDGETAWLLMSGAVRGRAGEVEFAFQRESLFDERAVAGAQCPPP